MRVILGQNVKISSTRTNDGTEYSTHVMCELLRKANITIQAAKPDTPTHNGTVERFSRELQERVRALIFDSGMPKQFWEHAIAYVIHIYNRTPKRALDNETSYEKLYKRKPDMRYIRQFSCLAFYK